MLVVRPCKDETIGCVGGQEMANGSYPASGTAGPGSVGQVSVRHGVPSCPEGPEIDSSILPCSRPSAMNSVR